MYSVYRLVCTVNGKKYIGMTSRTPDERFKDHCWCSHGKTRSFPLVNAIRKYGASAFRVETLASGLEKEQAAQLERQLIAQEKTRCREHGYNVAPGGEGFDPEAASAVVRRAWASKTPEQRAEWVANHAAALSAATPERRAETAAKWRAAMAAKTPEELAQQQAKRLATVRPRPPGWHAARVEKWREARAKMSPEERAAWSAKRVAVMRAHPPEIVAARVAKIRASQARRLQENPRTTCRRGHPWTPDNVFTWAAGKKRCKTCRKESKLRYYERKHGPVRRTPRATCERGHPWVVENIYTSPSGSRMCRVCKRERRPEERKARLLATLQLTRAA